MVLFSKLKLWDNKNKITKYWWSFLNIIWYWSINIVKGLIAKTETNDYKWWTHRSIYTKQKKNALMRDPKIVYLFEWMRTKISTKNIRNWKQYTVHWISVTDIRD